MLWKKMIRDIWSNKGSYLACLIIVIIGLIVFTSFSILSDNLNLSKETFYTEQNFSDGFVELDSMPRSSVERLNNIEGVKEINGRLVEELRVNDEDREESIYLKLVFFDTSKADRLNDVRLLDGEALDREGLNIIIDNQFYDANNLELNDVIEVIASGKIRELHIQGVGMSPEFTYPLRNETDLFPNPEQFGIAFLSLDDAGNLFPDKSNRVNNLVFTVEDNANFDLVSERLESELDGYGVKRTYSRDEHTSHMMLSEEVAMLERVSTALPLLFLGIAAIIIYIMLKRLVEQQRVQIGILKAFGYTNKEILTHYISYALLIGSLGGIIGGTLGIISATPLTSLLLEFFNVPEMYERFSLYYLLLGLMLSLIVFLIAGYQGCKYSLKLKPAEAMRPPAPVFKGKTLLERISFFWNMLTIQGKMAIRNLSRNRSRSIFMFIGIMLSCSIVAMTWSLNDMVDKLTLRQYEEIEVYDAKINLANPMNRVLVERELRNHDEITRIEPMSEVPVTLSYLWNEENVLLIGLKENTRLYNILDSDSRRVTPTAKGLILSERLAQKLDVSVGSTIELESPYFRNNDEKKDIKVSKIIPQYLGMNAYLEINALDEVLDQGSLATSFLINTDDENDTASISDLRNKYRESEIVTGVDARAERIKQTEELLDMFGSVIYIYVFVGIIIGFAIIYSSSFIILSERSRELASMRVLGMTSKEVFAVITFEQWFISFFAILAAVPLAKIMQWSLSEELSTDHYIIPSDISIMSLAVAVLLTALSIWIAQRFALRRVKNLSLVDVLKSRE